MKEMITYRYYGLLRELTLTDFKLKYKASFFGYLWSLVKPLMLFGVLYIVFAKFFKLGKEIPNYPVFLLLGIVLWTFFMEATNSSLTSIVGRGELIRKVYFPRIILTVSASITALITLFLNIIVFFIFMAISSVLVPSTAPIFLLILIEFFLFTAGVSLFLSSWFVRFRDVGHIWEVFAQALFYATPIIYPLGLVPESFQKFLMLNPLAQIIQDSRYVLVSHDSETAYSILSFPLLLIPYALPLIIFAVGYWYYQKEAYKFAEEL